jgi:hypothetical protein
MFDIHAVWDARTLTMALSALVSAGTALWSWLVQELRIPVVISTVVMPRLSGRLPSQNAAYEPQTMASHGCTTRAPPGRKPVRTAS